MNVRDAIIDRITLDPATARTIVLGIRAAFNVAALILTPTNPTLSEDLKKGANIIGVTASFIEVAGSVSLGKSKSFDLKDGLKFTKDVFSAIQAPWSIASLVNNIYKLVVQNPLFQIPVLSAVFSGITIVSSTVQIALDIRELIGLSGKLSASMGDTSILHEDLDVDPLKQAFNIETNKPAYIQTEMGKKVLSIALNVLVIASAIIGIALLFAAPGALVALTIAATVVSGTMTLIGITSYVLKIISPTLKEPTVQALETAGFVARQQESDESETSYAELA